MVDSSVQTQGCRLNEQLSAWASLFVSLRACVAETDVTYQCPTQYEMRVADE
jgi:hypothetical protein